MNIQQSYREAAVRGASPVELVIRLYEQIVEDLRQASLAVDQNDIERRTQRIKHSLLVLGHLQSSLDFAAGGKVARDLDNFYNVLRGRLMQVQFRPAKAALRQVITDILAVREAWIQVDRAEKQKASALSGAPATAAANAAADRPRVNWKG